MPSGVTSTRLADVLSRENFVLHDDLQQDKRSTLHAVVSMFRDYQVPYVVIGGLAVQLYNIQVRPTLDVDVAALRQPFERLKAEQPWARYGFELVFDHRRFIKLRHTASNVEVDINVDTRFAHLLDEPVTESVDGHPVCFCSLANLAFTKLRTQRSDWPRDYAKRLQDRADLAGILRAHPEIVESLRTDPKTTEEMRQILEEIGQALAACPDEDLPPDDESDIPA